MSQANEFVQFWDRPLSIHTYNCTISHKWVITRYNCFLWPVPVLPALRSMDQRQSSSQPTETWRLQKIWKFGWIQVFSQPWGEKSTTSPRQKSDQFDLPWRKWHRHLGGMRITGSYTLNGLLIAPPLRPPHSTATQRWCYSRYSIDSFSSIKRPEFCILLFSYRDPS